jgi:hypothetical protein
MFFEKTLIDHCTTALNHLEINYLTKWMIHIVKWGLWKYELQKGHTKYWDLQVWWLAMRCRLRWQAFLASLSSYIFIIWLWIWPTNLNPTKCDSNNQFGWYKSVVLGILITNSFVPMNNANGYGKVGYCSTLWYIAWCHYSKRWFLTSNL